MYRRKTFDDLREERTTEEFTVVPDSKSNSIRVIRKKKKNHLPDLFRNETELKKAAADLLQALPRCELFKTDNSALRVKGGKRAKSREPGMADQHLCITGRFVALEAKMPGKDLDQKLKQDKYRDKVHRGEGIHIVYHSLDELVEGLKKHRLVSRKFEIN